MTDSNNFGVQFVQGKESTIMSQQYREGFLYFATDTKRIFMDAKGNSKMPMGGNSGIFYGQMTLQDTPDDNQKEFTFTLSDLEVNNDTETLTIPNIDDLILNIPDGCFYRVSEIDGEGEDASILTNKLTIAGSGGGGGSGDGPGSLAGLTFNRITTQSFTTLSGIACPIQFTVTAKDSAGEMTGNGTYVVKVNNKEKARGDVINNNPDNPSDYNEIDVGPYLGSGENDVRIYVYMDTGGSSFTEASKLWKITTTSISFKWDYSFNDVNYTDEQFKLDWVISGGAGIEKTTHVLINNQEFEELKDVTSGTGSRSVWIDPVKYSLGHGTHRIELYVTAEVGISSLRTPSQIKNVIFAERNNSNYIINYDFYEDVIGQYDTVKIPLTIYGEDNISGNATVVLKENGSDKGLMENFANGEVREWAYTPIASGPQVLSMICGTTEKTLLVDVRSLGITIEEVPNYAFKFKANEFADNASIQKWSSNNVTASFSEKFDWINGGLKTELDDNGNPRQFVCVKAGSTMTIDYSVFGKDARTDGKCVKIIFKATKCKDYDAQAVSCHDGSRGLILNAQNAIFNSSNIRFEVPYCEDSCIEFEFDIASTKEKKYYVRPWIDGIPSGIKIYNPQSDTFATSANNKLVIGSDDCDVYIYLIKVYEKHLTDDDHLNNFIADAPNSAEMISRFQRNDILDENGEISPTRLAEKNPKCKVHTYEIDRMTMHKKDKVKGCSYTQYQGSKNAVLSAENVTIKVQGTSSAAYGLAAFNLDSEFGDGFTDADGNHIDGWSMNEGSIPVNFFCTKVNVASCENANNAMNQEWYNRYQPYQTVLRGRKPGARDTMEFTNGVLFILDKNKTTNDTENGGKGDNVFKDTEGYIDNPYMKMYSVCNMGNSKDNIEVLHDTENPMECCIENGDNQLPGQWMTVPQGGYKEGDSFITVDLEDIDPDHTTLCPDGEYRSNRVLWENGLDEIAEFRYPDGIDTVKEEFPEQAEALITGWYRFVNWMSKSNPSEKYAVIEFVDDYEVAEYKNAEEFAADTSTKYIQNEDTKEYELATEYSEDEVYYVYYAVDKYNRYKKNLYIITDNDTKIHELVSKETPFNSDAVYYRETDHIFGATNEKLPAPVSFSAYEFKGYKAPGELANYQKDYTPILKGHKENAYARTYEYDTTDYRMAKMLSECEDYLCMDSVVYHYLFIERHTMVDNVAKNTFWSSEDGLVWNLTKDYDNDTADGNDNQGKLSLTYGFEPGDINPATGTSVFNAGNSVWLKFISGLYSTCQKMYQALDSSQGDLPSAWSADAYLQTFKEWQSIIPERCWIEDYYRKYIRPYEVYNDTMFLEMNEGGLKTYQRKQYETYQNYYISSKYFGSACKTNYFTMRPNGEDLSNFAIPITLYADCYIHGAFGSGTDNPNYSRRCKRNTEILMTSPIDNATDATTYLFPANLYQSLGTQSTGLNSLKLKQFTVTSAKKLRVLSLGSYASGTSNDALDTFGVESCENLEELYVARMKNAKLSTLDLTGSPGIKKVDARESSFSGIVMPAGSPLESLQLNKPTSIVLSNLRDLQTLTFQDTSALGKIDINNIDTSAINSKNDIIDKIGNSLEQARTLEVRWNINSAIVNGENEIDETNNTIRILEKLRNTDDFLTDNGVPVPKTAALSGTLTISGEVYNKADSINIYNKYAQNDIYPNLDIIFEGVNAKLPKVTIYNGNNQSCWSRRIVNDTQMNDTFLSSGPNGAYTESMITKQPSVSAVYTFENKWEVFNGETKIATIEGKEPVYTGKITEDISIKPVFTESVRQYNIKFYTYNLATDKVDSILLDTTVDYGTLLSTQIPNSIPYKPEPDNYGLKEANNFIGYGLTPQAITPVASDYVVSNDQNFYAIFEKVEDITQVVHHDWFDYIPYDYEQDQFILQNNPDLPNDIFPDGKPLGKIHGYSIKMNRALKGKITIPSFHPIDGLPIISLGQDFALGQDERNHHLTHLFCEKNSQLYEIQFQAFWGNAYLKYFDFSQNTVRYIAKHGFYQCSNLDPNLFSLSNKLYFIGEEAFLMSFKTTSPTVLKIPGSVSLVGARGFANLLQSCPNGSSLEVGSETDPSKLYGLYPTPSSERIIQKFVQNEQIRTFRFWSTRYSSLEEKLGSYQVANIFVKSLGDINNYNIEINYRGV